MLEKSESDGEEFVVDALGDFEPMKGTSVRSDVVDGGALEFCRRLERGCFVQAEDELAGRQGG